MLHTGPSLWESEAEKYEAIWAEEEYSRDSPGARYVDLFVEMIGGLPPKGQTVLDVGCGNGAGSLALADTGLKVTTLDLVDVRVGGAREFSHVQQAIWHALPQSWDYVYCADVLEHLPTEFTMLAAMNAVTAAKRGAFFTVGLVEDNLGALIGERLHLTVAPFVWWRDHLAELTDLIEARDFLQTGVFYVRRA